MNIILFILIKNGYYGKPFINEWGFYSTLNIISNKHGKYIIMLPTILISLTD